MYVHRSVPCSTLVKIVIMLFINHNNVLIFTSRVVFQVTVLSAKILFTLFFTPAYLKTLSTGWMSILENHKKRRELMCSCFLCSSLRESFSKQQTNFSCIKQTVYQTLLVCIPANSVPQLH